MFLAPVLTSCHRSLLLARVRAGQETGGNNQQLLGEELLPGEPPGSDLKGKGPAPGREEKQKGVSPYWLREASAI